MKDAIGQVDCSERARRRIERFYRMVCVEFPWLWALRHEWDFSDLSTMPTVRRLGDPGLKGHLQADSSLLRPQTWLVIKRGVGAHVIQIGASRGTTWMRAIDRTLCATHGYVGKAQIIYVAVVQARVIGENAKWVTIYRSPAGGWKWSIGKPLFGFDKRALQ
ncbi:MAG: hypothetical protein WC734_02445 [Patescibacteria group bacterium]